MNTPYRMKSALKHSHLAQLFCELMQQGRLADACLAPDEGNAAAVSPGIIEPIC